MLIYDQEKRQIHLPFMRILLLNHLFSSTFPPLLPAHLPTQFRNHRQVSTTGVTLKDHSPIKGPAVAPGQMSWRSYEKVWKRPPMVHQISQVFHYSRPSQGSSDEQERRLWRGCWEINSLHHNFHTRGDHSPHHISRVKQSLLPLVLRQQGVHLTLFEGGRPRLKSKQFNGNILESIFLSSQPRSAIVA